MATEPDTWLGTGAALGLAVLAVGAVALVHHVVARLIASRAPTFVELARRTRPAWLSVLLVVLVWAAGASTLPRTQSWWPVLDRALLIATIATGAWLLATVFSFGFDRLLARDAHVTGPEGRRRRTQLLVIHRLTLVVIAVIAVSLVLFSFPAMRVVGTSLLASAGILSIVAGLAAQSILGNLIAGVQLAFTDAVRVGDVVVVEGEWGRIGEITLSYVVVYIWDERRLVLPCHYFTTRPFETWTRHGDQIIGVVLMDLDWRLPMDAVRTRFLEVVAGHEAWDERVAAALVTGSEGGLVRVRFTMSAQDPSDAWRLRCDVREQMMTWLQREHPEALPTSRIVVESAGGRSGIEKQHDQDQP